MYKKTTVFTEGNTTTRQRKPERINIQAPTARSNTVKPLISGHHWNFVCKCPHNTGCPLTCM